MPRAHWSLLVALLGVWPWTSSLAQASGDAGTLRFTYSLEVSRKETLVESRDGVAMQFLAAARQAVSLREAGKMGPSRRTAFLGEIQYLADSIAQLEGQISEAEAAAGEARRALIDALETERENLRRAAAEAEPQERRQMEARLEGLAAELEELRRLEDSSDTADPLAAARSTLSALARIVAEERARLGTLNRLQDELRLFLGTLRLFDETGMPPSARAEGGGDTDAGPGCATVCGLPSPDATTSSPADLPIGHFGAEGAGNARSGGVSYITRESLTRLREQLSAFAGSTGIPSGPFGPEEERTVTRQLALGVSALSFRGEGLRRTALRLNTGWSMLLSRALGNGMQVTVEPRLGGRSVQLDAGSSAEAAGEVRESLLGTLGGGRFLWQINSWQKGRFLSEPLPEPAYLEPGRAEGGLSGLATLALHPNWEVMLGGGGDMVRYGPDEWKVLDRQGVNAYSALARQGASGSARLSVTASQHRFSSDAGEQREDTRVGVGADWSLEGRAVLRLSAAATWNDSRIPAYDFRSGRAALTLSFPWQGGSFQAYGALAHRDYLNPGPEDARVAPSDQDTGSILALQLTRPVDDDHTITVRADWSRSVTGFRNDFYQRFGIGVQLNLRGLGGL